ncbi:bifunctional nuclease family protein [Arachnia propionica]|uniref:Bifunctional nuclease family protein n=1 Tax=Arachnia propionica TaxID=1750 RepID=A0A3P1TCF4_9ACTN|nr:bifunctional nuclease family protein [Arachnia propionica]MDO5083712.1 bifunctional nuclease family protein [Arachnia propionica]RRD07131.1 bifunctional nuclease family protein [Arachnia propionica]
MAELVVEGIRMIDDSPVLLLRERDGDRILPIWIATVDAAAIAVALDGDVLGRPLTHDLLAQTLDLLAGGRPPVLTISAVEDGVFLAEITVAGQSLDARPSDLVAVAVRRGWDIECPARLLDEVGVVGEPDSGDEVERFREFLDQVEPDDFSPPPGQDQP